MKMNIEHLFTSRCRRNVNVAASNSISDIEREREREREKERKRERGGVELNAGFRTIF